MKIESLRSSFLAAVVDSDDVRRNALAEHLKGLSYQCQTFLSYGDLEKSFTTDPPHFIFLSVDDPALAIHEALISIKHTLPETYVILLSPVETLGQTLSAFEEFIYDCLPLPLNSALQLSKAVDRAAYANYLLYQNEQLNERLGKIDHEEDPAELAEPSPASNAPSDGLAAFQDWLEGLYSQPHQDQAVNSFFAGVEKLNPRYKVVYFKYIPHRRTLMSAQWAGFAESEAKNVGLSFNDMDAHFNVEQLRDPMSVKLLEEMATTVFKASSFLWLTQQVLGEVRGLFLIVGDGGAFAGVDRYFSAFTKHCELLELEKRLHSNLFKDTSTGTLNKHTFLRHLAEEVSRARRLQLPVSLVYLSLDQHPDLLKQYGQEDAEVMIRSLARILVKHSRVNDVVGRLAHDQFAMILPHTPLAGALIKAERIRRLVELADFSKIIKSMGRLTISLSVGEYPSLCSDADDLLQSVDEHLYKLKTETSNKIIQVKERAGFTADFPVEKGTF